MEKDIDLKEYNDRVEVVKDSISKLDNNVQIIENDNKYLYDIVVSIDDVEFGATVRSGNFEKTKGFIDYKDRLSRFIDKIEKPVIIFYVNRMNKDVFISPVINYEVGDLQVKNRIAKRTLTQRNLNKLRDEINMNKL